MDMKFFTIILSIVAVIVVIIGILYFFWHETAVAPTVDGNDGYIQNQQDKITNQSSKNMKITSIAFENQQKIPSKFTCDGDNVNPPLKIEGVPAGAASLALIADDPDAPAGAWTHWTVWNISPQTSEIMENSMPQGAIQGKTSFGKPGWGGPCPPSGTHRYFFKLYALDRMLDLTGEASVKELEKAMAGHILESAELVGLYSRQQ